MKSYFFFILTAFFLFSCKKETQVSANNAVTPSKNSSHEMIISENVNFEPTERFVLLKSGDFRYKIANEKLPFKKIMMLNASLVGFVTELGQEDKIIGVSSPEYIYSEKVHQLIDSKKIANVGNEQKYDVEKIISLKPDAIFTNYYENFSNTYDLLKQNGIEVIFLDDFKENNPLEKSKYLLIFGKLLGAEKQATNRFKEIEKEYNNLRNLAQKSQIKPLVLSNEMYGNQWFLPGGKTNLARFIFDANAYYINAENRDSKAVPMSFEEVFAKSQNAEFWVNVGNHKSKRELLQINPNYSKMNVFNKGKLYTVTGSERENSNDYFESGVVRSDLILKDYIKIFHPELLPDYSLTYLKELK